MKRSTEPKSPTRSLIHIPIIHTQADMGGLRESVDRAKIKRLGRQQWERNVNLIDQMWTEIEKTIAGLDLDLNYQRVRLYQDGLPVCGRELDIVTELAQLGSRNHQLLLRLKGKGATIMGTESSELLVEEYQLAKQVLAAAARPKVARIQARQKAMSDSLLNQRDQFIAARINSTLQSHETGMLFLGMFHSLEKWLDNNIELICPVFQPKDRIARKKETAGLATGSD